jgi:hypothetical protein
MGVGRLDRLEALVVFTIPAEVMQDRGRGNPVSLIGSDGSWVVSERECAEREWRGPDVGARGDTACRKYMGDKDLTNQRAL